MMRRVDENVRVSKNNRIEIAKLRFGTTKTGAD